MNLNMTIALALALSVSAGVTAAPQPQVVMNSMEGGGDVDKKIKFPRLTKLPDAKVMSRINATLAKKEAEERQGATDCIANVKGAGQSFSVASYDVSVKVTYLSTKYLSLTDHVNYDCAGAHPDFVESVLIFDLATGVEVDVMTAFKPEFDFAKIYAARYRLPKAKNDDPDCRSWATDGTSGLGELRPYLDSKIGIVISVETAHVVAACADDLELSVADLQKHLKDRALLADLKQNVKPK